MRATVACFAILPLETRLSSDEFVGVFEPTQLVVGAVEAVGAWCVDVPL